MKKLVLILGILLCACGINDNQISKIPQETPYLDQESIQMITDLLFVPDVAFTQEHGTALQIMGNMMFLHDMFGNDSYLTVQNKPTAERLIISGGINPKYKNNNAETQFVKASYTMGGKYDWNDVLTMPESVIINNRLEKSSNNLWQKPLLETESTNTKENIVNVQKMGGYDGVEQLRIFTTAENSLRAIATARKQLPEMKDIASVSYIATVPALGLRCDRKNWAKHPLIQQYVYGELLRVIKYSKTGDIKLTDSEQQKLKNIVRKLDLD